jgi:hypothetical protein
MSTCFSVPHSTYQVLSIVYCRSTSTGAQPLRITGPYNPGHARCGQQPSSCALVRPALMALSQVSAMSLSVVIRGSCGSSHASSGCGPILNTTIGPLDPAANRTETLGLTAGAAFEFPLLGTTRNSGLYLLGRPLLLLLLRDS